jgi:serine/threonine protein kinase
MGNQNSGFSIDEKSEDAVIGSGTYGIVYKARRDADKFPCAAKLLKMALVDPANPDQTEVTIKKIKDECSFLESLKHTNIVHYLGVTRDRELRAPVLLMELLPDAESLTKMLEWFRKNYIDEPLPYFIELNICCDVASAVEYLHSKNVVIRNLSSNNVLVIAKTRAKVADFGMCRLNDATNTASSGMTVYMPPEALEQNPVYTPKLDCFTQGVIMIQVCTREMPDPGERKETVEVNTGPVIALIPECKRRRSHISQIQNRDELIKIAKDCLKDKAEDRPESTEIHERLATLKTTQKYRNSLESDCEKLWKAITIHARLMLGNEKKMKEYTVEKNEAENEENTGEETNASVNEQFEQALKKADKICVLVVGTSGDGVSTLLNGLLGEKIITECQSRERGKTFTSSVTKYNIRSVVEVTVIECRNLHADLMNIDDNVNEVMEKMKQNGYPDLIIYSQKMGENIDVVSQTKHKSVIARLTADFAKLDESIPYKDILWKRCLFVLTFANKFKSSLSERRDEEKMFNRRWDEWKKIFKEALRDSKVRIRKDEFKVCIAGFKESKLHKSDHWLSDIWQLAFLTLPKSGALALLRINAFRFVKAALISEDLHPAEQLIVIDQSVPVISTAGAAAGIGAAGTASAVTGAAIGGTIGAVGIGIVSFGVAAGAGLALGIALGGAAGLGVSGGIAAAVKRYRENKNFTKLPALAITPDN